MRAFLLSACFCIQVFAQLKWDQTELEFHPSVMETNVLASFPFKNTGNYPVTITTVKTSCGCTKAGFDGGSIAPGATNAIQASFSFEERSGLQHKEILVGMDDAKCPMQVLTLRVWIPEILKMEPEFVVWHKNEEKISRTIAVHILGQSGIQVVGVTSDNKRFLTELKPIKKAEEYQIIITPKDVNSPFVDTIRVEVDFPREQHRIFTIYAQIRQD